MCLGVVVSLSGSSTVLLVNLSPVEMDRASTLMGLGAIMHDASPLPVVSATSTGDSYCRSEVPARESGELNVVKGLVVRP